MNEFELTDSHLEYILPGISGKNISLYLPLLNKFMPEYRINTPQRVAAFIAQIGYESGSFMYAEEIASGIDYEGRKDLGNTSKGDGKRYKGRGLMQITGKTNYRDVSNALMVDFVNYPDLLKTPDYAVESACWFWQSKGLNELADKGDFLRITKIINGGYNGLSEREANYNRAKKIFRV